MGIINEHFIDQNIDIKTSTENIEINRKRAKYYSSYFFDSKIVQFAQIFELKFS